MRQQMLIQKRLFDRPIFDKAHACISRTNEYVQTNDEITYTWFYLMRTKQNDMQTWYKSCPNLPEFTIFVCMSCIASLKWINSLHRTSHTWHNQIEEVSSQKEKIYARFVRMMRASSKSLPATPIFLFVCTMRWTSVNPEYAK